MSLVSVESSTEQPGALRDLTNDFMTGLMVQPVFARGAYRRRRVLVGGGLVLAASCMIYVVMVLLSLFASPGARPAPGVAESGAALVNQASPRSPSMKADAPTDAEPAVRRRIRARAAGRQPVRNPSHPGSRAATGSAWLTTVAPSKAALTGAASSPKPTFTPGAQAVLKAPPSIGAALKASAPSRMVTPSTVRTAGGA